ncbi:MAG TPA: MYXO-CTERM sorting domain-containing protein [Polyangiaceae bacterium]
MRALTPSGAFVASLVAAWLLPSVHVARAADVNADPSNYTTALATLKPGDTLHLAAGKYAPMGSTPLPLSNLNGTSSQWITVTGPPADPPTAVFQASPDGCCNVVEITNSSYLAIENLYIDGMHVAGAFGISAKGETSNVVHDVRVESCTLVDMDNDGDPADLGQQDDGISTKVPTWGWIIRHNKILGAGTGMYLGNSTGTDPFIDGVIDDNLVDKPTGYCIEIKQQNPWPSVPGIPTQPTTTVLSNNVFIKADHAATTSGPRPQVLVDGFPTTGPGAQNHYELYGNLFVHDDEDYLVQATGRVHVHDNIFVDDAMYGAVNFTDHDGYTVIDAIAYNNTVYGVGTGIAFSNAPSGIGFAVGNAVFATTAFSGMVATQTSNVTDTVANAGQYVNKPSVTLGSMDFYPKTGSPLRGAKMDLSSVSTDVGYDLDFNGTKKDFTYRGAYSGEGTNPGWPLGDGTKDGGPPPDGGAADGGGGDSGSSSGGSGGGGGSGSSSSGSGGGGDGGANQEGPAGTGSSKGCGCAQAGAADTGAWGAIFGMAIALAITRRRR